MRRDLGNKPHLEDRVTRIDVRRRERRPRILNAFEVTPTNRFDTPSGTPKQPMVERRLPVRVTDRSEELRLFLLLNNGKFVLRIQPSPKVNKLIVETIETDYRHLFISARLP